MYRPGRVLGMKSWFMVLTVAALAFAGCNDKDDTKPKVHDDDLEADEETGIIRGVVVDEGFRPLPGVLVTAVSGDQGPAETTTREDGTFGYGELVPGSYLLRAQKLGHVSGQASTEVVAGVQDPKAVRIVLLADPESHPYATTTKISGFIECSVRAYDATGLTAGLPLIGGQPFYYGLNACSAAGGVGNQQTEFPFDFEGTPSYVQGELQWTSSQSTGSGLTLVAGPPDCRDIKWGRADGESPLVVGLNETVLEENVEDGSEEATCFRVFSWVAPETGNFVGAAVSQDFDLYLTAFYNFLPDDGWTFIADGEAEPPK